jgi:hypothetical protein
MTRSVTRMTIDDAAHISPEQRAAIIASYPPHEQEARVKGIPTLGSGRVFPVSEESITVDPIELPEHWARLGAIDFGYDHPTAAVRLAHNRDTDCVYITTSYRVREQIPLFHAAALKPWGDKMPWAWPPDANQRDKRAGGTLKEDYTRHGLDMLPEHAQFEDGGNSVEAGIMQMLERMQTGRLKVFKGLNDWFDEFRLYHRKDGLIVKEYDDLMDATRYGLMDLRHAERPKRKPLRRQDTSWAV